MTLTDGLIDLWCMSEGSPAVVAAGALAAMPLNLGRTDIWANGPLPASEGWWLDPTERDIYNGAGIGEIPVENQPAFENVGDGVTIACRIWPEAGRLEEPTLWPAGFTHAMAGMGGVIAHSPVDRTGFGIEISELTLPGEDIPFWLVQRNGMLLEYYWIEGSKIPREGERFDPFLLVITIERNDKDNPRPDPAFTANFGSASSPDAAGRLLAMQAANANQNDPAFVSAGLIPGLGAQPITETEDEDDPGLSGAAWAAPFLTVTLYINGVQNGEPFEYLALGLTDKTKISLGSLVPSVGGFGQGGLWDRVLTTTEIASLGDSLDAVGLCGAATPCPAGLGTINPLMNADGTSGIHPMWIGAVSEPVGAIAGEGPHRQTRRVHEETGRIFELQFSNATGDEVKRVIEALQLTRGAVTTKWRHPEDAAGTVCEAADWLVGSTLDLERNRGGHLAQFSLTLTEIE